MANKLAQLQQLRALAVRTQAAIAAVAKAASDAITQVANEKADKNHSHSKSDVGLGNVDNTADSAKSVSYANSAGSAGSAAIAAQLGRDGNVSTPMTFKWEGQFGQPFWVWGGDDGINMRVYAPSNFHVAYADSSGSAGNLPYTITFEGCYAGTGTGGSASAPIVFTLSQQYDAVGVISCGSYGDKACVARNLLELLTHENSSESFSNNFIPTGMLSSDWTALKDIPAGCCVIAGVWANGSTSAQKYMRLNGTNLELYVTSYADNAAHAINSSGKVYYYYGLNFIPFHF